MLFNFLSLSLCYAQVNSNFTGLIQVTGSSSFYFSGSDSNPALCSDSNYTFAAQVSPSVHDINDLNIASAYLAGTYGIAKPAVKISGIFNELFSEYTAYTNISLNVSDKLTLGSRISYNSLNVKNYSELSYMAVDIGGIVAFGDNLKAGFALYNINAGKYGDESETAYRVAAFALGASLTENLGIEITTIIRNYYSSGIALSGKYLLIDDLLAVSAGYLTKPRTFQTTIQIQAINGINIQLSLCMIQELGYNKNMGVALDW